MDVSCKKFNMLLCSHSKGPRKQGPGEQSHLENCKVWIFPCGRFIPCRFSGQVVIPCHSKTWVSYLSSQCAVATQWANITATGENPASLQGNSQERGRKCVQTCTLTTEYRQFREQHNRNCYNKVRATVVEHGKRQSQSWRQLTSSREISV